MIEKVYILTRDDINELLFLLRSTNSVDLKVHSATEYELDERGYINKSVKVFESILNLIYQDEIDIYDLIDKQFEMEDLPEKIKEKLSKV